MADTLGSGTIELIVDARKVRAGIEDAKKSIRTLGEGQKDISKNASASIDRYIAKLQQQNATINKSARETDLYKLALRGASNEQLKIADAALRVTENSQKSADSIQRLRTGFVALGAIGAVGLIAAAAALQSLVHNVGEFQDMAEKVGDTAANLASLSVAAHVGSASMEEVVAASVKLTKGLTGVDDETKAAGAAVTALGLNLQTFKTLAPADQFDAVAKALAGFKDGTEKTAVAVALFGKNGAQLLPFLKELGGETGRQNILTDEQIRLADAYSDRQKKLRAELALYAGAIASQMLPAYNDLIGAFTDLIKGIAGVDAGAKGLNNSTAIQDFAESGARSLAFLIDAIDGVARTWQFLTLNIGAAGATVAAAMKLDLGLIQQIEAERKSQQDAIALRPQLGQLLDARIAARKAGGPPAAPGADSRRTLNFSGAEKKDGSGAAEAAAKAQLQFDLEQIKKVSEARINALSNEEKVLEAFRSADLVSDKQYYAAKLLFIQQNSAEQETALQQEIARLQRETFSGKNAAAERLDNNRKIVDVEGKLAKIRADASANIEINGIQEAAANRRLVQSYVDAQEAANAYIATIARRNQLELAGIGQGNRFRETQGGRNDIKDKLTSRRQDLTRDLRNNQITRETFKTELRIAQETYSKEIILFDDLIEAKLTAEGNWVNGAKEALQNYYDESRNVAKLTEDVWTNSLKSAEDALTEFVTKGKLDFKSLVDSIAAEMVRKDIKEHVTGPLSNWLKGIVGNIGSSSSSGGSGSSGGSDGSSIIDFFGGILGSHETGINYIPKTGIYQLHEGERVVPKSENTGGGGSGGMVVHNNFTIAGPVDRRTQMQIADAAYQGARRANARNG